MFLTATRSALRTFPQRISTRGYASVATHRSKNTTSTFPLVAGLLGGFSAYCYYSSNQLANENKKDTAFTSEFKPFKLIQRHDYNDNTTKFDFEIPAGKTGELPYCSALLVRVEKDGKPVIRAYTPVTPEGVSDRLEFLIKEYPDGNVSKHIHSLKPGDTLDIKGPIRKFNYEPNQFKDVILLAGGTGITPMFQLIQAIRNNPNDKTKIHLIYANNAEKDILLKDELNKLLKSDDVKFVLTQPPSGWKGETGYITPELIKATGVPRSDDSHVFVCGPPPFMDALSGNKTPKGEQGELTGALKDLGFTKDDVYKF